MFTRTLPFEDRSVDVVFAYSVLQHMDDRNCEQSVREIGRVLKSDGEMLVQMANALGVRSIYSKARRGFRGARGFEVRYRTPWALRRLFSPARSEVDIQPDCYLGLGLQPGDRQLLGATGRLAVACSERLKSLSARLPLLRQVADSVWVHARRNEA